MDLLQSSVVTLSLVAMIVGTILALIPILPGVLIVWAIALVTGWATQFERVTPLAAIIITLIMIVNVSNDFWLPLLGIKTNGLSCLSALGAFFGGIVGTFAIPLPILGTLIGTVAGALLVEVIASRRTQAAVNAGKTAFRLFLIGYAIEIVSVFAVLLIYLISIFSTGGAV